MKYTEEKLEKVLVNLLIMKVLSSFLIRKLDKWKLTIAIDGKPFKHEFYV